MKNSKFRSFRFRIIQYSLLSLFCSVLTIAGIGLAMLGIYAAIGGNVNDILSRPVLRIVMNDDFTWQEIDESQIIKGNEIAAANQNNLRANEIQSNVINNRKEDMRSQEENKIYLQIQGIVVIGIGILGVLLFILYFLKMTRKFTQYMIQLTDGISEISFGNFDSTIDIDSNDEFGDIADKVNHMALDLSEIIHNERMNEQRKNELITSVAHDLRTPLTSIIGYLDLVKKPDLPEEEREKYISIAYTKSKRLEQLIEDLFSYTQYTEGDVTVVEDQVDIVKLVEQLLDEFYPSFTEAHLECEFQKDCSTLVTYADGNLMARAFANLIGNAIKYGKDGKRVEVFLTHTSEKVKIVVKNYGEIIPKKDLAYIFERFYRVESSRSIKTGGTGLGLAIAQSIVKMHQGEIKVESNRSGTVFEVQLPIQKEQANLKSMSEGEVRALNDQSRGGSDE